MSQKYKTQIAFRAHKGKFAIPQGTLIEITAHKHKPNRVDVRGNCPHCGSRIRGHMQDGPGLWNYVYEAMDFQPIHTSMKVLKVDEPLPTEVGGTGFMRSLQAQRIDEEQEIWQWEVFRDSRGGETVVLNRNGMLQLRKYIDEQLGIDTTYFENGK